MSTKRSKSSRGEGPVGDLHNRLSRKYPKIEVWAAGGVVLREHRGVAEVLLIHRPVHRDWSFPKGKLDSGETLGKAAWREVHEETGFRCKRLERLPLIRYRDGRGRRKAVVYWTMQVLDGQFEPNSEVDALGWFDLLSARRVLTYEHDVLLLDSVTGAVPSLRMLA
ncbi:MAG: NUDIX hydrolase [Acidimicrobiaceae bacterium]|nr:NUDIX hydrolase [Acidimicrobiaceae bacterium]MYD06747.1 NUDIX hydrolase [Acidimicrobiaceae bacterium]MYI58967.1 NUDIX hydrolase [Acidimicrobiaceae bacterium]